MFWLVGHALAQDCAPVHSTQSLLEGLVAVETALREADLDAAAVGSVRLELLLECPEEPLPPAVLARMFRAVGAPRGGDDRDGWFQRAKALQPRFEYGREEAPAEVREAWRAVEVVPVLRPAPHVLGDPPPRLVYPYPWEKQPLMVGGLTAIVGGGILAGFAVREGTLARGSVGSEAERHRRTARWLTAGSAGLFTVGLGAATWGVLIDDGLGLRVTLPL